LLFKLTIMKMSGSSVDVLGAHRSRRSSVRMPSPYDLQAIMDSQHSSQAGSLASDGGSTNTHITADNPPNTSGQISRRSSHHGIDRQVHTVVRRTRSQLAAQSASSCSTSGKVLSTANKTNHDYTINIYIAELCNTHSWPGTNLSQTMAEEAFSQANAHARKNRTPTTDSTDTRSIERRVSYIFICFLNKL